MLAIKVNTMKFLVEGIVGKRYPQQFKVEVEAKSEKHARDLTLIRVGSKGAVRKSQISIIKIEVNKSKA